MFFSEACERVSYGVPRQGESKVMPNLPYGIFPMNTDFEGGLDDIFAMLESKANILCKRKGGRRKKVDSYLCRYVRESKITVKKECVGGI